MRQQFIRVYGWLVVLAILAAMVAHVFALREVSRQVDERLMDGMGEPMERLSERLREVQGRPQATRAVIGTIRRDLGSRARLVSTETAVALGADRSTLPNGAVQVVQEEGRRSMVAWVADDRVLVVGPFRDRFRGRPWFVFTWTGIIVLVVGLGLMATLRPLERRLGVLSETAERFGKGELQVRSADNATDGIGQLSKEFNGMADRVESLLRRQREQLRAVSHELRTPLARVFFLVDEALESTQASQKDAALHRIERSVHEMNELVEELLLFARLDPDAGEFRREEFELGPIFDELVEMVHEIKPSLVVQVERRVDRAWGSPRYIRRALLNLVTNAARYARRQVAISVQVVDGRLVVRVEDDGQGIAEEHREMVFEPFAQLEAKGSEGETGGAGLGLAIVRRITRAHGGDVIATNGELGGALFEMNFPLKPGTPTSSPA
jgi:signal transduction histidine kinase